MRQQRRAGAGSGRGRQGPLGSCCARVRVQAGLPLVCAGQEAEGVQGAVQGLVEVAGGRAEARQGCVGAARGLSSEKKNFRNFIKQVTKFLCPIIGSHRF